MEYRPSIYLTKPHIYFAISIWFACPWAVKNETFVGAILFFFLKKYGFDGSAIGRICILSLNNDNIYGALDQCITSTHFIKSVPTFYKKE